MLCLLNNKLHKIIVSFFVVTFLVIPVQAISPKYLSVVADLPLPSGLVEEIESSLSFNKLEGSLFSWLRSGEVLQIVFVEEINILIARFSITPR